MRMFLPIVMLATFSPAVRAQQHQAREWHCVKQPFAETPEGNVVALGCAAALPKGENLDSNDDNILAKLQIIRHNALELTANSQDERANAIVKGVENPKHWDLDTGKGKEIMNAIRMGFGQTVGQLCQKHPNIVLAPLFPGLASGTSTLYGCKNITTAPEK